MKSERKLRCIIAALRDANKAACADGREDIHGTLKAIIGVLNYVGEFKPSGDEETEELGATANLLDGMDRAFSRNQAEKN